MPDDRIAVRRTAKLFVGGAFPRSESGRSYPVHRADGSLIAHAARGSRKDVRDAVAAARGAAGTWSRATAYNRGQVLYRVAELLEGRREQLAGEIAQAEGGDGVAAHAQVDDAVDALVSTAGWADKLAQVGGSANPVAGPYFTFSVPEPVGVVGVLAPARPALLGLVAVVAPVIVSGNVAVVVASEPHPLPAVTLGEILATADVPAGVVNILTGRTAELAPVLAAHGDVDALSLSGLEPGAAADLTRAAADRVARVVTPPCGDGWRTDGSPRPVLAFTELKTVWHPVGV